jgi:hypothetical protein
VDEKKSFIKYKVYFENVRGVGWWHILLGGSLILKYFMFAFLLHHGCSLQAMLCWILSSKLK